MVLLWARCFIEANERVNNNKLVGGCCCCCAAAAVEVALEVEAEAEDPITTEQNRQDRAELN